jgi:hypothetical protein
MYASSSLACQHFMRHSLPQKSKLLAISSLDVLTIGFLQHQAVNPTPNPQPWGPGLCIWLPKTGWPSYTPWHWVPILVTFYDMHELRWDYHYPPVTTQRCVCVVTSYLKIHFTDVSIWQYSKSWLNIVPVNSVSLLRWYYYHTKTPHVMLTHYYITVQMSRSTRWTPCSGRKRKNLWVSVKLLPTSHHLLASPLAISEYNLSY